LVGIFPSLVPLAALGLILVQVSAIVLHAIRKETAQTLWLNSILAGAMDPPLRSVRGKSAVTI
jgi:hypothetical protein